MILAKRVELRGLINAQHNAQRIKLNTKPMVNVNNEKGRFNNQSIHVILIGFIIAGNIPIDLIELNLIKG